MSLLRICRGRCLLENPTPTDATCIVASTLGISPCSSHGLGRCPNRRLRRTVQIFWPWSRRCANDLATTVYEQGSGLAGHHPHPAIPSLLHLHLDPALLGEVTITNTQCPQLPLTMPALTSKSWFINTGSVRTSSPAQLSLTCVCGHSMARLLSAGYSGGHVNVVLISSLGVRRSR